VVAAVSDVHYWLVPVRPGAPVAVGVPAERDDNTA
jgi:hypothetical protein